MSIFVNRNGQQLGPFSEAELKAKLLAGEISPNDFVWWQGQADWKPLAQTSLAAGSIVPGTAAAAAYQPTGMPTSQLAIWALVCGCVSMVCWLFISIPAVILGHMALKDLKRNPMQEGRGMATAGLILGYISLAIGLVYFLIYFSVVIISILIALGEQAKHGH